MRKAVPYSILGFLGYGFYSCFQENIYSHRYQFIFWKPQTDTVLGEWTSSMLREQFAKKYKFTAKTSQEQEFVDKLTQLLITHAIRSDDPIVNRKWEVDIVKSTVANAMACADGSIFVFRGLLRNVESVDELAFIISHEIAHTLCRHIPNEISTTSIFTLFLLPFVGGEWGFIIQNYLVSKPMSRMCEAEADKIGVQICVDAGFDAEKGAEFFKRQHKSDWGTLFSTHPSNSSRVAAIKEENKTAMQKRLNLLSSIETQEIVKLNKIFKELKLFYESQK